MSADKIRSAVKEMSKTGDEVYSIVCKVLSVNISEKTCDCEPIDGKADLLDVRLMAQSQTGFFITPKVNSIVVVTMINGFTGYVAMFSEISEIQLNGSNYDGLPQIQVMVDKYNNLEQKVNDLIIACSSQIVTLAPSGTFPLASFFASVTPLTPTTQVELENITVKHGNG